jgi:hypothetical protein
VPARQVERERDLAGGRVDQAGRAEHHPPDPLQRRPGRLGRLDDGGVHDAYRVLGVGEGDVDPAGDLPGDVHCGGHHVLGAHLDPDDVRGGRHHGVHLRVGAAAAGLLADPRDQAALLQPLHKLGRGHLGQPGQLAELGAGQWPLGEQQLQGGAVVQGTQEAWRAGDRRWTHRRNDL